MAIFTVFQLNFDNKNTDDTTVEHTISSYWIVILLLLFSLDASMKLIKI